MIRPPFLARALEIIQLHEPYTMKITAIRPLPLCLSAREKNEKQNKNLIN